MCGLVVGMCKATELVVLGLALFSVDGVGICKWKADKCYRVDDRCFAPTNCGKIRGG